VDTEALMTAANFLSFLAIIFSMIGVVFLFVEVDRNHKFSRFMPMVQVFRKRLEFERSKFSDPSDYLRPNVRGENFNEEIFEQTMRAFRIKSPLPVWMKKEIIDFAYLLARDPEQWEGAIGDNQSYMTGLRMTRNASLLRWGVGLLLLSGLLQLIGLILSVLSKGM
jgi:hypothetical protein